jgi:general secretion pathway protein E
MLSNNLMNIFSLSENREKRTFMDLKLFSRHKIISYLKGLSPSIFKSGTKTGNDGHTVVSGGSKSNHKKVLNWDPKSDEETVRSLSQRLGIPYLSILQYPDNPYRCNGLSYKFLKQNKVFPLGLKDNILSIAVADPRDIPTLEAIQLATGYQLELYLSTERDILESLEKYYGAGVDTMEEIIEDIETTDLEAISGEEDIDHLRDMASEAPVIRLVNLIISRAIESRASDIHIEPFEHHLKVRYRIDGMLHDVESPPIRLKAAITSRIKIMAKLNIAERRLPQDGRLKLRIAGNEIDFRVSTIPTMFGESIVMRLLNRESLILNLGELGFSPQTLDVFETLIKRPYGMILVTGPTGSGKTTTLYAALDKINSPEKKIITVEDPVEYQLDGVNQIQVKPQIGLTFASGLRSIVRQDPDIILIGEIRDAETAEIAIQSALTGHLVFSTLHTNDAPGAITRLLEMGVEDYLLASSLIGVLAQRLVRIICPYCKEPLPIQENINSGVEELLGTTTTYYGKGCEQCAHTGYLGRSGIFEILPVTEEIKSLILKRADSGTIKELALKQGMKTLREDGWDKVRQGITTIAEVLRVTQEE